MFPQPLPGISLPGSKLDVIDATTVDVDATTIDDVKSGTQLATPSFSAVKTQSLKSWTMLARVWTS